MAAQIMISKDGAVETIAFRNPPFNFISNQMLEELHLELTRVRDDASVRVLVLTGGMSDSFITHYDVQQLLSLTEGRALQPMGSTAARAIAWCSTKLDRHGGLERLALKAMARRPEAERGVFLWSRCLELLDSMPKPVIAAINGLSLGGGCELALCCDFRFMANDSRYKIGLPEVLVGIVPGGTGTPQRLPRIVGEAMALEILLTGALYTPQQAQAMGLVNKAVPRDELMPHVMELAQRLSRGAPLAQAAIKQGVRKGGRMTFAESRASDLQTTSEAMFSSDARRGMARYVERVTEVGELNVDRLMEQTERLRDGREVEYTGN